MTRRIWIKALKWVQMQKVGLRHRNGWERKKIRSQLKRIARRMESAWSGTRSGEGVYAYITSMVERLEGLLKQQPPQ